MAAAGMLQAVGQATGSLATWRDASQAFAAPTNLAVLAAVVRGQPQLHAQVSTQNRLRQVPHIQGDQVIRSGSFLSEPPEQCSGRRLASLLGWCEDLAVPAAVVQVQPQLHAWVTSNRLLCRVTYGEEDQVVRGSNNSTSYHILPSKT